MAVRDWRFLGDLMVAANRANTVRALPRSMGETLEPWDVVRVLVSSATEAFAASADNGWCAHRAERPRRTPSAPVLRERRAGPLLSLPLGDLHVQIELGPRAPKLSTDPRYLQTLVEVLAVAVDRQRLIERVAALSRRAHGESRRLRAAVDQLANTPAPVARSEAMKAAVRRAEMVAAFDTPVLISGESGTGKEVLARLIHRQSDRASRPFLQLNCAAIPDPLIESELFGHVRGAFTGAERDHRGVFERADRGTLLLDEIGELTPAAQVKLLRVLQEKVVTPVGGESERSVDVRIIGATHRPLRAMAERGEFREDLLYRIDVFPIPVPPLRQRAADLPVLVAELLDAISARLRVERPAVAPEIVARLGEHRWPGNVRELANVLEAALVFGGGELKLPPGFPEVRRRATVESFDQVCRAAIASALTASRGKIYGRGGAAEMLELHPATLQSKMRKFGLRRDSFTG